MYDMRTYCCPLLGAYENRTVAMVRNTIGTISTYSSSITTVVVLLLSELRKRLAGQPQAYMRHVAAAAEYRSSREILVVMGDGSQVRQSNSTEYSVYLPHAHGVTCCCWARQGWWL